MVARSGAFVRGLPDHPLLDRIIRGRAWIPLLGVLLAGIVAMQVEVLKLNASTGRALERGTALQSRNELLQASVASLADDQRIESMAARMGLVMPAPEAIKFLTLGQPGDAQPALINVHQPDATSFASQLALTNPASGAGAAAASTIAPIGTAGAGGATDTTAPSSSAGATTDTTASPPPTDTPVQPAQAPTDTTAQSSPATSSAGPTQTTSVTTPPQTDQGAGSPPGSGGGVASSSGGVAATATGT